MRHVSAVIVVAVVVCLVTFPKHHHVTSIISMTTADAATVPPAGITTADVTPADVTNADVATVTSPQPATTVKTVEPDLLWQGTAGEIAILVGVILFLVIVLALTCSLRRCLVCCTLQHCWCGSGGSQGEDYDE